MRPRSYYIAKSLQSFDCQITKAFWVINTNFKFKSKLQKVLEFLLKPSTAVILQVKRNVMTRVNMYEKVSSVNNSIGHKLNLFSPFCAYNCICISQIIQK